MREYVTETCERSLKRIFGNVDFNKRRLKILIEFAYKCPTHKVNQYGNKITCRNRPTKSKSQQIVIGGKPNRKSDSLK